MVVRPQVLSLCAGIGGLDLGLRMACGARTVGYVERDAYAAAVLVARMADEALDPAPIWDDLATFDGRAWRGGVDLVAAGYPCQPFSHAGSRGGVTDERHLWPHVARIIGEVEPAFVFLENVAGHVSLGFDAVLGDLSALGFDAEWGCVRASDAGSTHRRERLFVLAYADGAGLEGRGLRECERADQQSPWPPGPQDADGWRAYLAAGGPEPAIRRGPDGAAHRVDRLRCLGNAVVPQQAALAFRVLARRAGLEVAP